MLWLSVPLLVLAAAAQATFVPQLRVLDGQPDLIFLIVIAWSIHATPQHAIIWAFVGGILQDLLSAAPLGTTTLGLVLVIALLDGIRGQLQRVGLLTYMSLVLVGSFITKFVLLGVLVASGFSIQPFTSLTQNIIPAAAYNLVIMLPVYIVVRLLQRRVTPAVDPARTARVVSTEY